MDSDHTKVKVVLGGAESIFTGVTVSDIKASHVDFATNIKIANFNGGKPSANGSGLIISADTTSRPAVVSAEFIAVDKLKIKFDRALVLTNTDPISAGSVEYITLDNNGAKLTMGKDGAGNMALDTTDTTNVTLLVTLDAAQDAYVTTGFGTDSTITGLGIKSASGIKAASSGLEVAAFGAATSSADHKRIAADTTAPTAMTATQLEYLAYNNTALKVTNSTALPPSEKARLEVYIGADTPSKVAGTFTAYSVYGTSTSAPFNTTGDFITSVVGAAVPVTHKVFYRLKDVAGNITDWQQRGTVGLPAGTYKKVAATSTVAGEAVVSNTNTLVVGNGTTSTSYDITNNATVKNLMTNLVANDTFTVDSSSLISAIASTNLTAPATVTLTAADLASTVAVTGDNDQLLTVAGTATSKTVTFAAANGGYTLTATGVTTATVSGASTGTIKIGADVTTVNVSAAVTTLDIAGAVTTLNVSATVTTLTATAAKTVTTLTLASTGAITNNTGAGNLTITNIDQSAVATDRTIALGDMTTTIATVKGHATNKLTLTATGALTITAIQSGNVDVSGCSGTLNVVATGATKVTATGKTLTAVSGAQTIEIAGATAATVNGAVTTLTASAAVTTLTVNAVVTTLNVTATGTKVVTGAAAGATNIVVSNVAATAIEAVEANAITVNVAAVTTATNYVSFKANDAISSDIVVTTANTASATATTNVPNPAAAVGSGITQWNIASSAAAGVTTQYITTNAANTIKLNPIASGVTVTLTKL